MISLLFFEKEDAMPVIVKARYRRDIAEMPPRCRRDTRHRQGELKLDDSPMHSPALDVISA